LEEIYLSAKQLGAAIDKPVRTIENWAAGSHIKQNSQGKYGLISAYKYQLATLAEKLERNEQRLEEAEADKDEVKKMAGQRKLIAEADKEEAIAQIKQLELAKMKGELVDADEVLDAWKGAIAKAKAKFISIPAKLALELSGLDKPADIQLRLTQVIDEALVELGDQDH
jgi:hypothetical protein